MRFVFRNLGLVMLALALAALCYDGARMLANDALAVSSSRQLWIAVSPAGYEAAQAWLSEAAPGLWSAAALPLLLFPAWMTAGALGSLFFLIGYRPPPPEIVPDEA